MIVLYSPSETSFSNMGLGALGDAISCSVEEELNGMYEMVLQMPISSIHFNDITIRSIIFAKPSPYREAQPFRVYQIDVPINGVATIHAHHISYDLNGIPLKNGADYRATNVTTALQMIESASLVSTNFSTWTNMSKSGNFSIDTPRSYRNAIGGEEGSIIDVFHGELEFDRFKVKLWNKRGKTSNVQVTYAVNMTDFSMERNQENVFTGIYAYWTDNEDRRSSSPLVPVGDAMHPVYLLDSAGKYLLDSNGNYLLVRGSYDYHRIFMLDLSSEFNFAPIPDQLACAAQRYIQTHNLTLPTINLNVNFARIEESTEYSGLSALDSVDLADYITVNYPLIGLTATAQITQIVYDALNNKYSSMTVGQPKLNIADTISMLERQIRR